MADGDIDIDDILFSGAACTYAHTPPAHARPYVVPGWRRWLSFPLFFPSRRNISS